MPTSKPSALALKIAADAVPHSTYTTDQRPGVVAHAASIIDTELRPLVEACDVALRRSADRMQAHADSVAKYQQGDARDFRGLAERCRRARSALNTAKAAQ
ncbi:MAG: hypothetical protein GY946_01065 [bacterium]|nr:hypothetical protein [bacterium]